MSMKPMLSKEYLKKVKSLYYTKGYSAREVGEELNVSIDAVYKFMIRYDLERRTFEETNRIRFEKKSLSYCIKKNLTEKEKQLKIACIMLYWAEGSKKRHRNKGQRRGATVDLANSDPDMIRLFLRFLREICRVDEKRLRIYLYCYANQDVNSLKKYWCKVTNVPMNQFIKPYVREDFSLEKIGVMKYGLIHVRYSDTKLFDQLFIWIKNYLDNNL